jgi:hypothetical protein
MGQVIDRALVRLRGQHPQASESPLFSQLQAALSGKDDEASDAALSALLGTTPGDLRVQRHRLRRQYGECVRAIVSETVVGDELVDEEIRHLIDVLA